MANEDRNISADPKKQIVVVILDMKGKVREVPVAGSYRWAGTVDGMYQVITDQETAEFNLGNILVVRLTFRPRTAQGEGRGAR